MDPAVGHGYLLSRNDPGNGCGFLLFLSSSRWMGGGVGSETICFSAGSLYELSLSSLGIEYESIF